MSSSPPAMGVVLAAGRGARLGNLTMRRSKAMLPVAGKPMVVRVLEMLSRGGCEAFAVVVHPEDNELASCLSAAPWSSRVQMVAQPRRLGMAHALACAAPLARASGRREFILASCDNIFPDGHVARLDAHRRSRNLDAAVTLLQVSARQIPTIAVVKMEEGLVRSIVEKPRPEDAPSDLGVPSLHSLSTRIFDYLADVPTSARGELEFPDALRMLIEDGGRVGGVRTASRLTLTRPPDLVALGSHFLRRDPTCRFVTSLLPPQTFIRPPVRIEDGAIVGRGCTIGPLAVLEGGCHIGQGAMVRHSAVLRGGTVAPDVEIEGAVVA